MDFHLTKEQLLVRKMYRDFAENEVKPLAAEIDEEERFPMETVEKMAKLGMMGIYFPKEYGGAGADVLSYAMCVEELAKVCGTTAVIVSAHTSLCAAPIFENGTEEQKMKYLPDLCSGKKIGAFGLTEPGAGTDAQGQQTTAVLDESGENYILNGSKCFITNGNVADTFVVIAVTGKTVDKRGRSMKEISAFIVEKDDKGFSQGKHEKKMGIRGSSTCDLIFEDCVIPKDRMLGKKGEGFKIAMKTLDGGRIGIASQALGLGEGAVEEAIKYTKERVQFGKRISQFQNTQFQLAEMHTRMQAAQFLYDLGANGYLHENFAAADLAEAQELFTTGQTAMYYIGSWEMSAMLDKSLSDDMKGKIDYFTLPEMREGTTNANQINVAGGTPMCFSAEKWDEQTEQLILYYCQYMGDYQSQYEFTPAKGYEAPKGETEHDQQIIDRIAEDMANVEGVIRLYDLEFDPTTNTNNGPLAVSLALNDITPEEFCAAVDESVEQNAADWFDDVAEELLKAEK